MNRLNESRVLELIEWRVKQIERKLFEGEQLSDLADVDTSGAGEGDVLTFLSGLWSPAAPGAGADIPTGVFVPFGGSSAPTGFLLCNGAAVSRTVYDDLFAVIGTVYGAGDGSTTFNLPDVRGRTVIGAGQGPGLSTRTLGTSLGTETHQLTIAQMPTHSHGVSVRAENGTDPQIVRQANAGFSSAASTTPQGGNQAHPNMQPSIVANWIIKT